MGKKDSGCLSPLLGNMVVPGTTVLSLPNESSQVVRLGDGVRQTGSTVVATAAGEVCYAKPGRYWVEHSQKRYIPQLDEPVVGVITARMGDNLEVDINAPSRAILPMLAFEGATRRNRPNAKVGSLVYARVVAADRDLEPELSCTDTQGKSAGFGVLTEGYQFSSTTGLARMLLSSPPCTVLVALGDHISYEIAVGLNGRIWVKSGNAQSTVLVSNAILNSEFITAAQAQRMVKALAEHVKQQAQ